MGMSEFQFKHAVRQNTHLLIGIAAPSGGGKTWSLLELAMGLTKNGKIAVIDTEANRSLHYADFFSFDQVDLTPPFSPDRYCDAIDAAEEAGYDVIMIDSFSHEHAGIGGLLEMAEAELRKPNMKSPANWAAPKAKHKKMMGRLLQCRAHLLFSLRAEERIRIVKVPDGRGGERTAVESAGYVPVTEKNFPFELTASFLMTPDAPGMPKPLKLQEQHRPFFPLDAPITRAAGRQLAAWAAGGIPTPTDEPVTLALAEAKADGGGDAFRAWWKTLTKSNRDMLRPSLPALQARAEKADTAAAEPEDDDPFGLPPIETPATDGDNSPHLGKENAGQDDHGNRAGFGLGGAGAAPVDPSREPIDREEVMPNGRREPRSRAHNATAPAEAGATPPATLYVAIAKEQGQPANWVKTRGDLCEATTTLRTPADIAAFRKLSAGTLAGLRENDRDGYAQVQAAVKDREAVLQGEGA
jgi:hypothetical protein